MRNWTIKEAVEIIREGTDFAGMKEIASFNPVFFKAVCENDVAGVAGLMGEKFTLRRLSREALDDVDENDEVETSADEKASAPKSKAKAPAKAASDANLEEMTTKELIAECDARGIKVPKYGKNKAFYLEQLAGSDGADEAAVDEDEAEDEENPYEGKNAMTLFKMCKERGIKAEPRQKTKVYIDLLTADDAAGAEDVDDDDDSCADEEEDEKPVKAAIRSWRSGKAKEKAPAKPTKKAEPAADDEEWDI